MAVKWGWAERLLVALEYPSDQKEVEVSAKDVCLRLTLNAVDTIGCSFADLSITGATVEHEIDAQKWAESVVGRVTYLSEPLSVIEVNYTRGAQIKSDPPDRHDGAICYYEFLLTSHSGHPLSLRCRRRCYRKSENEISLTAIPCVLTLETLKRLVSDIEATWPNRSVADEQGPAEQWSPLT